MQAYPHTTEPSHHTSLIASTLLEDWCYPRRVKMADLASVTAEIKSTGETIASRKAAKASKEEIAPLVTQLLALKTKYAELNNGVPYDPPKTDDKKKDKKPPTPPVQETKREGPSKKELNKLARKAGRQGNKEGGDGITNESASAATGGPAYKPSGPVLYTVNFTPKAMPDICRHVAALLNINVAFEGVPATVQSFQPYIDNVQQGSISGDMNIARFLVKVTNMKSHTTLYGDKENDHWLQAQIDQWLECCMNGTPSTLPPLVNSHLSNRTFLVGSSLTLADIAVYLFLMKQKMSPKSPEVVTSLPHIARFMEMLNAHMPSKLPDLKLPSNKNKGQQPSSGTAASGNSAGSSGSTNENAAEDGGECPPLEGAIDGKVCTRFPPEPSGYLHIGHAKAVLLNQYYAQRYKGTLLVRFDDTNPSKEKEEYADNIIKDLATLEVKAHKVSHTSDHFAKLEEYARKIIKDGLAFMDDTDQEKMQAERMEHVESYRRNTSVEENLKLFEQLVKGDPKTKSFCLRAKIDMKSVNGTMRDPVLYRSNDIPHHRTGTKFKAYPTYDFACPIVDSIEGVTHALRTTEYDDRNAQYEWLQDAMKLRKTNILTFGKINFINTVLSKRKLNWFVEQGHVEGWFDPRFPTIQGCMRRGMTVSALKSFILSQGASKRIISMEWDKFWAENKKVLEESAHRYMSVSKDTCVPFTITNLPTEESIVSIPLHPQKPDMGTRVSRRFNKLLLDQEDVNTFVEGEEITLLRWGNFFVDKIEKDGSGKIIGLTGRAHPEATNFSKTKKMSWLAAVPDLVTCTLVEFDHLISKAKLGEDEDFKDFVNPETRFQSVALCDPCLREVKQGQIIQLERRGFYRCDVPYTPGKSDPVLFFVPDGKVMKKK